jgi:pyridoxal phosphate enzyme (YggS family)
MGKSFLSLLILEHGMPAYIMKTTASSLEAVQSRIAKAAQSADRQPNEITLLVASKTHPAERVREAWLAGQTIFGENYLQEALAKMPALADLPIEWHFIGPIQSNKTKRIAENFSWVHSVDRIKVADRLSKDRPESLPPLQICLQVNVSGEASKSGVAPEELAHLAAHVIHLPKLKLRGLMAVPELTTATALQRSQFHMLRELAEGLKKEGYILDTLSMGMSEDLDIAIAEGATMVRVGTAIFGPRRYPIPEELAVQTPR